MKADSERHLTPDEIVGSVFPIAEGPSEVSAHLSGCDGCRARVSRLREAWLLDRGAVEGAVEALPEPFWEAQRAAILQSIQGTAEPVRPPTSGIHPFPEASRKRRPLRRPALALGSLAAAIALVAVLSVRRFGGSSSSAPAAAAVATPTVLAAPSADQTDDELLLSIDRILREEPAFTSLVPDEST